MFDVYVGMMTQWNTKGTNGIELYYNPFDTVMKITLHIIMHSKKYIDWPTKYNYINVLAFPFLVFSLKVNSLFFTTPSFEK